MKYLILFALIFVPSFMIGQTFISEYNQVTDYDGKVRKFYQEIGEWSLTDSLITHKYGNGSICHKMYLRAGRSVYYYNDYEESVKITFNIDGSVLRKNDKHPDEYVIYRKK